MIAFWNDVLGVTREIEALDAFVSVPVLRVGFCYVYNLTDFLTFVFCEVGIYNFYGALYGTFFVLGHTDPRPAAPRPRGSLAALPKAQWIQGMWLQVKD